MISACQNRDLFSVVPLVLPLNCCLSHSAAPCAVWCPLAVSGHGERRYLGLGVIFYSDIEWKEDVWGFLGGVFFLPLYEWGSGFPLRSSMTILLQPVLQRGVSFFLIGLEPLFLLCHWTCPMWDLVEFHC